MKDAFFVLCIVIIWELFRFSISNAKRFWWEEEQDERLEECQMCFQRVPNLEYHRPRCKSKPRFTHTWIKPE